MPRVVALELFELDLPFRQRFRHAAAERATSGSLFARCVTDSGHCGFGETLPRRYVTGEEQGAAFDLLATRILPRLLDLEFTSFREILDFLVRCDGNAPGEWVPAQVPQTAAWCLVDLALLDTFGRALNRDLHAELTAETLGVEPCAWPEPLRYSAVVPGDAGGRLLSTLLKVRLYGIEHVKLKVDGDSLSGVRLARQVLGRRARLRVDSNMAWSVQEAPSRMERMAGYGVESFEQPLPPDDLAAMARLVKETGLEVMADESLHDAASLERLIDARACTAVNVRIAKCGGLIASLARCRRALQAGLALQIGCHVGETSQLSAAQMALVRAVGKGVRYLEGCYGERLLQSDPIRPRLQFRRRGRPPRPPSGVGFGTEVDLDTIRRHCGRRIALGTPGRLLAEKMS